MVRAVALLALSLVPVVASPVAQEDLQEKPPEQRFVPPAPYVISPNRAAVSKAIDDCLGSITCARLSDFKRDYKQAYYWLRAWCDAQLVARKQPFQDAAPEGRVCIAIAADDASLEKAPTLDLEATRDLVAPGRCSTFGLTVPLYSIRYAEGGTVANGPIKAGLGGGYYWGEKPLGLCKPDFSMGPSVFAWSEGLDPSGVFQVGVAGGYQLTAFKFFSVGIALGYDLYRSSPGVSANGLFAGKLMGKQSITWLLTLSFSGTAESKGSQE